MSIKSMDDLLDVEHTFEFRVGLAEILVPEPPSPLLGPCWWCGCTCPDNVHDCNRICDEATGMLRPTSELRSAAEQERQ